MRRRFRSGSIRAHVAMLVALLGVGSFASGAAPTFVIKLGKVNNTAIAGKGCQSFEVAPGDRLQFDIYLRDWSVGSEMASAVQTTVAPESYTSGTAGSIYPIGYEAMAAQGEPNQQAVSIDQANPYYIHFGKQTVAFVDTRNLDPGYRWISMIVDKKGPISRQDGREFLLGSLQARVSNDAAGTFSYDLVDHKDHSLILTNDRTQIPGIQVEGTRLVVKENPNRQWIVGSVPGWGSVDARDPAKNAGISEITLRFNKLTTELSPADFTITCSKGKAPSIASVEGKGRRAMVRLSGAVPPESWTTITHVSSGTSVQLGRIHGDSNQDGHCDEFDLTFMLGKLNRGGSDGLAPPQGDLNGDKVISPSDVLHLLAQLAHPMD
ncbi:MAG: hypothetical protein ACPGXK_15110 [Phycisphaerae bacterium]